MAGLKVFELHGDVRVEMGRLRADLNALRGHATQLSQELDRSKRVSTSAGAAMAGAFRSAVGQALQLASALALVISSATAVRAIKDQFNAGLQAIEDFRFGTVSLAAVLTSMAEKPDTAAFAQNLAFAKDAMLKLDLAAAKFLATGEQMRISFQAFAQRGIIPVTDEDFEALGRITDAIVIVTQGQQTERQLWQEIGAILDGRIVPGTSRLGMFIQAQVGDLKKWVDQHRRAGDLLPALEKMLHGFALAEGEIQDLASTWRNTLETVFNLIRREGFVKPYEDIRDLIKSITLSLLDMRTGQLTPLAHEIAAKINKAWEEFKELVVSTFNFLRDNGPTIIAGIVDAFKDLRDVFVLLRDIVGLIKALAEPDFAKRSKALRELWQRQISGPAEEEIGNAFAQTDAERSRREAARQAFAPHAGAKAAQPGVAGRPTRPAPLKPMPAPPDERKTLADFTKGLPLDIQQSWDQMAQRWSAMATSVMGSLSSVATSTRINFKAVADVIQDLINKAREVRNQILDIDATILDVRKEFLGLTPGEELVGLEAFRKTLDPVKDFDRFLGVSRQILGLTKETTQTRVEALRAEAAQLRERAAAFLTSDPFQADLARRAAIEREILAKSLVEQAKQKGQQMGQELLSALGQQRSDLVNHFTLLSTTAKQAVQSVGDQFTSLAQHISDSVTTAVRNAATQIQALTGEKITLPESVPIGGFKGPALPQLGFPAAPPAVSPAMPEKAEGVLVAGQKGIYIGGNLILEIDLPNWIKTPEEAKAFILKTVSEMANRTPAAP